MGSGGVLRLWKAPTFFVVVLALLTGCGFDRAAIHHRAGTFYASGNYAEAELQYRKLVSADASDVEAHYRLGLTYGKRLQVDKAYENLSVARRMAPAREDIASDLANLLLTSYWLDANRSATARKELSQLATSMLRIHPQSYQGYRVLGYLAVADRQFPAAIAAFSKALAIRPDDSDTTAMLIQAQFGAGDLQAGETLGRNHIRKMSSDDLVYDVLTRHYMARGEMGMVEVLLKERKEANPRSHDAQLRLAAFYQKTGDQQRLNGVLTALRSLPEGSFAVAEFYQKTGLLDNALTEFSAGAASKGPQSLLYEKRRIGILIGLRRFSEAQTIVDTLLPANPGDPELIRAKALVLMETANVPGRNPGGLHQADTALSLLRGLTAKDSQDFLSRYELGRMWIRQGDLVAGEAELQTTLRLSPGNPAVLVALASAALARLDYNSALQHSEAALRTQPDSKAARLSRLSALRGLGRFVEARQILRDLTAEHGSTPALDLEAAYVYLAEGKPEKAEPVFRRLYKPGLENVRVVAGLSEALVGVGRLEEAVKLLIADLAELPHRPLVRYALAEALLQKGDFKRAAAELENVIRDQPNLAPAYIQLSTLHLRDKEPGKALAVLRAGKSRFPKDPAIAGSLAQILDMTGATDQAEQGYRDWLRVQPEHPLANNNLGYLLAARGLHLDEALKFATIAVQRDPAAVRFRDTLGYVYFRKGLHTEAVRILANVVEREPRNPTYRFHYGVALLHTGNRSQSKLELAEALRQNPPQAILREATELLGSM